MRTERVAVRRILRTVKAAGFSLVAIDDGGDERLPVTTEAAAIDAIFSVDDSRVYFERTPGRRHWIYFVLGNAPDGSEVAADYTCERDDTDTDGGDFSRAVETATDYPIEADR